jgi:hypothetical protein
VLYLEEESHGPVNHCQILARLRCTEFQIIVFFIIKHFSFKYSIQNSFNAGIESVDMERDEKYNSE